VCGNEAGLVAVMAVLFLAVQIELYTIAKVLGNLRERIKRLEGQQRRKQLAKLERKAGKGLWSNPRRKWKW